MATTFLASPAAALSHNLLPKKPHVLSCSQTPQNQPIQKQNLQNEPIQLAQEQVQSSSDSSSSQVKPKRKTEADSTDWVASSLTRRFGIGAGLAWVGFLAFGVVSEQVKTRFEVSQQQSNTRDVEKEEEVVLPNGIRYYEMRIGGGEIPRAGDLVVLDLKGRVLNGETFVDTFGEGKRPLALVLGSRPYTRGMCEGVEQVVRTMRAGGKRRVIVPAELGFGEEGADFGDGVGVKGGKELEFVVQVDKVSIAPA
ncbi:hypothetical protein LUZ60_006290 [Juncus effusus]|nr:hypothetical protein LUZ60_006290 [Juncus effusus]